MTEPTNDPNTAASAESADAAEEESPAVGQGLPGRGITQVASQEFSLSESVGGVRGVVEAVLPGLVFVVVYIVTTELIPPLVAAGSVAVVLTAIRLIQGSPITQALSGLLGVGIGVVWALRSGQAADYFVLGLWTNAFGVAFAIASILARYPFIGVMVEFLRGRDQSWRTDPSRKAERKAYRAATWLWVAMFGLRLAVQLPLYLADNVAVLGTARLVMGIPLFALAAYLTWLLVRNLPGPATASGSAAGAAST